MPTSKELEEREKQLHCLKRGLAAPETGEKSESITMKYNKKITYNELKKKKMIDSRKCLSEMKH